MHDAVDFQRTHASVKARLFGVALVAPKFGRYEVVGFAGAGQFGRVYVGRDPVLHRRVAIKRTQGDQVLREAQAIAKLSHPNVVEVFEVGDGFVAMEFVPGRTLRKWLAAHAGGTSEVLRVMIEAGQGLAAAHRAGVVHRDFKPDNVMVSDDGRVKVMDFGLAVAPTGEGPIVGSPAYMALEQLRSGAADARADQFAFCVTLYEALNGERPFKAATPAAQMEALDAGVVARWRTDVPRWLRAAIARGLRPDPADRWPDMEALLGALRRPASRAVGWAALAGLGLPLATLALVSGRADSDFCAEGLASVWNEDEARRGFLASQVPHAAASWERTAASLEAYAQRWTEAQAATCGRPGGASEQGVACLAHRRRAMAQLLDVLADPEPQTVRQAPRATAGLPSIDACLDGSDDEASRMQASPAVAEAVQRAEMLLASGDLEAGAHVADEALTLATDASEAVRGRALLTQGRIRDAAGDYAGAAQVLGRAHAAAIAARWDRLAAVVAIELVFVVGNHLGRLEDGRRWQRDAEARLARLPSEPLLEATLRNNVGNLAFRAGRFEEARDAYERAYSLRRSVTGEDDLRVALMLNNVGIAERELRALDAALEHQSEALRDVEALLWPEHPKVAELLSNVAMVHEDKREHDEALVLLRRALEIQEGALGASHPKVATTLVNIGAVSWALGAFDETAAAFDRALAIFGDTLERDHAEVGQLMVNYAVLELDRGRHEAAVRLTDNALAALRPSVGAEHPSVGIALHMQGLALMELGRPDEALVRINEVVKVRTKLFGAEHERTAEALGDRGWALTEVGRLEEALADQNAALRVFEVGSLEEARGRATRGKTLHAMGRYEEAIADYGRAIELASRVLGADHLEVQEVVRDKTKAEAGIAR